MLARKLARLGELMSTAWLPRETLERMRLRRLRAMLAWCEREVPLYRESFRKAGVRASDLRALSDIALFPMVTREEVVAAYPDGILSRTPRPDDVVFRTSGTSGLFMNIAYSAEANDMLDAVYARALFSVGYRPWDSIAYFWWDAVPKPTRPYERLGLMRKHLVPVDPDPRVQLAALERLRPRVVYHFPSSLVMLANLLAERPNPLVRPELVIAHGEFMADEQRDAIERAFGCPVSNQYGAQEFNRMGWDCGRHEGLHEDVESVLVEVVADGRPVPEGDPGELVVTGLVNRLMPLVRYRIGDAGRRIRQPCSCGRGLPLFAITEGRLDDVLDLPEGRKIGPRTLAPRIEEVAGLLQYRVVQEAQARLAVSIVLDHGAPPEREAAVRAAIVEVVGAGVEVSVTAVPSIALSRRGKLRKIVGLRSHVASTAGRD